MAATTKAQLLDITNKEYAKLRTLIDSIGDASALAKSDDTSIKDIIGHRAHWITLFLGWYQDGQADKPVFFPAEGYKWNDLKRYNADVRAQQSSLGWAATQELLATNAAALLAFIESKDETALYSGPMKGANNNWTTGRWAEAAGASHYRSASKYIRAALKAQMAD